MNQLVMLSGSAKGGHNGISSMSLFEEVCDILGVEPGKIDIGKFSDGETKIKIKENVKGKDVYIFQSMYYPVNEYLMELLLIIDAVVRASADRVTIVVPYYGYARQDRRDRKVGTPISAKLVAKLIETAGADRILTMDLHTDQIEGFFDIPIDQLYSWKVGIEHFTKLVEDKNPSAIYYH